jgi:hypothetical protein
MPGKNQIEMNNKENKDGDSKNDTKDSDIHKTNTANLGDRQKGMRKYNTKGAFSRFAVDKKDGNTDEKEDKKGDSAEIEIEQNAKNLSPRLMWKKKRFVKEGNEKKILK